jgi:putative pyruvate formate lyase activating enzyme
VGVFGSGTIFFSGCNLRCVFCQNHDISLEDHGFPVSAEHLADSMLELQRQGCPNINLVTPSHVVPQILEALLLAAREGLCLPVVYNSSGYDSLKALYLLEGVVDIYMPDFKFWSETAAERYGRAPDYPRVARAALREMHRQVGGLKLDDSGLAMHGLLVRHLLLPGGDEETRAILRFVAEEISPDTAIHLMGQYHPNYRSALPSELRRTLPPGQLESARRYAGELGLTRVL